MDVFFLREELWKSIMEEIKKLKSLPWNESQLRKALKNLKKNKTSDPNGMINEIFMEGCAGDDLVSALLSMYNGIKMNFHFPEHILWENIVTIYKK